MAPKAILAMLVIGAWLTGAPAHAHAATLQVGAGRADITPPTGYFTMGWVRSDARAIGQHTRLWARTVVIRQGSRKVALVSADLGAIAGGVVVEAAKRLRRRGFSERNILVSASHTHAGPTGYFNFDTFNTVFLTIRTPTDFQLTGGLDPTLYQFLVSQLTRSIRRADRDLEPGQLGWGRTRLKNLTENRSLEAHLHNHGIEAPFGTGTVAQDPRGRLHTISPDVNVLRVDKTAGGRRTPIGIWATFANHGTVNGFQFSLYNADHHGAATLHSERRIRRRGRVPAGQQVVTVFGNSDEGDMSSALDGRGPAVAERIGRAEARAFIRAWRQAGRRMSRRTELVNRWTRFCFCGQDTAAGPSDDEAVFGLPQLTGSEEGRGPLFDLTRQPFEGITNPLASGPQGHKLTTLSLGIPTATPLAAIRIGDRLIVSVPGEMTAEMGRRVRASARAATRGAGIRRVVISGLANEYVDYFTTPEEYDAQHYEGGSTVYGRTSSVALAEGIEALARSLARGKPAPPPHPFDLTNGVEPDGSSFPAGAATGQLIRQPAPRVERLGRASFRWRGAPLGLDRPLERAFVTVQRRARGRWVAADTDLGLRIIWHVDEDGRYSAEWEPPLDQRAGRYRFRISARRYGLRSRSFKLRPSRALVVRRAAAQPGHFAVRLEYPAARANQETGDPAGDLGADLSWRPAHAGRGGRVEFRVANKPVTARADSKGRYAVPANRHDRIEIRAGAARDRWGNRNGEAFAFVR